MTEDTVQYVPPGVLPHLNGHSLQRHSTCYPSPLRKAFHCRNRRMRALPLRCLNTKLTCKIIRCSNLGRFVDQSDHVAKYEWGTIPNATVTPRCSAHPPATEGSTLSFDSLPFQQVRRLNPKRSRQTVNHIDARIVDTPLKRADICPINPSTMRKLFLRQTLGPPHTTKVVRHHISNFHIREDRLLLTILPRSILYKIDCAIDRLTTGGSFAGSGQVRSIFRNKDIRNAKHAKDRRSCRGYCNGS